MPNESKNEAKIRGKQKPRNAPYQLGQLPPSLAVAIGKHLVHRLTVGQVDITGDDFGEIFARSINGLHRGKPLGIADVVWENCAWSVKTVKSVHPFLQPKVRIISGRNNVKYSFGIENPHADIVKTGRAILEIWNKRLDTSLNEYDDLRIFIFVRNMSTLEFTLAEIEPTRFVPSEYRWQKNAKGNLEGYDIQRNEHRFTWQTSTQFTVFHHIPASAYRFRIKRRPPTLSQEHVLRLARFDEDWIEPVTATEPNAEKIIELENELKDENAEKSD
jgi:hypothetical protein